MYQMGGMSQQCLGSSMGVNSLDLQNQHNPSGINDALHSMVMSLCLI